MQAAIFARLAAFAADFARIQNANDAGGNYGEFRYRYDIIRD